MIDKQCRNIGNRGKETMKKLMMMMLTMFVGMQSVFAMNVDEFIDKNIAPVTDAKRNAPKRDDKISISHDAFSITSRLFIYKLTKRHPPTVPVHIIPGIPRFK